MTPAHPADATPHRTIRTRNGSDPAPEIYVGSVDELCSDDTGGGRGPVAFRAVLAAAFLLVAIAAGVLAGGGLRLAGGAGTAETAGGAPTTTPEFDILPGPTDADAPTTERPEEDGPRRNAWAAITGSSAGADTDTDDSVVADEPVVDTTAAPVAATASTPTTAAPKADVAGIASVAAQAPTTTAAPIPVTAPPTTAAPAPPPTTVSVGGNEAAILACIRARESGGNYSIASPGGTYMGAYQFSQSTWNSTAQHAGRPDLVGTPPNHAAPADQDALALDLLRWQGLAPWGGYCG